MTSESILTIDQLSAVTAAMAADTHNCYRPSHILRDDTGEIVGAFSTHSAPILYFWMDSRKRNPLAAARGYKLAEAAIIQLGHEHIVLPIQITSPFYSHVAEMGFQHLMRGVELFEKVLVPVGAGPH